MNNPSSPVMDRPNLICPDCNYQFQKRDIRDLDRRSFQTLIDSCSCPLCCSDVHPEDALLEYFDQIPTSEIPARPTQIGGFVTGGTINLKVGSTKEVSLLGGNSMTIDLSLLGETDQPGGLSLCDLAGQQIQWYLGPFVIDNAVIVDISQIDDSTVGFITSNLESMISDSITVAYNIHPRLSNIEQPPWLELLGSAAQLYNQGEGMAMLPLLIASYDNHLARQLHRTLELVGRSDEEINEFFHKDYYRWRDRSKEGLEEAASERLSTYIPIIWDKFVKLRKEERNNSIIHIDSKAGVANISVQEMQDYFETIMETIIGIYKICYQHRNDY